MKSLLSLALVAGAAVAAIPAGSATPASAAVTCTLCGGGEYHPIAQPRRIFDSRPIDRNGTGPINDVVPLGRKQIQPAGGLFTVDLLGLGAPLSTPWLPADVLAPTDVLAVVASVTVVSPSQSGFLKAYAAGETAPNASLLNFLGGRNVSNLAILRPNAQGLLTMSIHGPAGTADVLIDVFGWFSTSSYRAAVDGDERGARLIPIDPVRIVDTRIVGGPIGAKAAREVPIRGAVQLGTSAPMVVPADPSVVGVVLNITGVQPSSPTFLSVVPADPNGTPPTTSNVNLLAGAVKANLVVVPLDPINGDVFVYNSAGATNVVVDVVGYMQTGAPEPTRAGRVVPLTTPFRAFDTRSPQFGGVPLGPKQAEDWSFAAFAGSVNIGGIPVGLQSALLGNLTNARLSFADSSFLTVYPSPGPSVTSGPPPVVSNLNTARTPGPNGVPVPNMALVRYNPADQTVRVYNSAGYADYLLDVSAVVLADPAP